MQVQSFISNHSYFFLIICKQELFLLLEEKSMENYLTSRAMEEVDANNASGITDCFSAEPNLMVIVKHIIETKKYEMLPAVYPYFAREQILNGDDELRDLFLPLYCELACSEEAASRKLLFEIMQKTELRKSSLWYILGKEGIEWKKIKIEDKILGTYLDGALDGHHFSLLEPHEKHKPCLKRRAADLLNEEAMDYFGYDDTTLQCYFDNTTTIDHLQKLFEILSRKEANYLPFANKYLRCHCERDKDFCRYLLRIGATMKDVAKTKLYVEKRELYNFYFGEDV